MNSLKNLPAPFADRADVAWQPHPRFEGIRLKILISGTDNPKCSIAVAQVPPGAEIGMHTHPEEIESIYGLAGEGIMTLEDTEIPFRVGQVVSVPMGMIHSLRNENDADLEILAIFTPPLF